VVTVYEDQDVSGAKGRQQRPQLDRLLKDAVRCRFDLPAAWAVDRLGRSLPDVLATLADGYERRRGSPAQGDHRPWPAAPRASWRDTASYSPEISWLV
jgi:hypothetical protein